MRSVPIPPEEIRDWLVEKVRRYREFALEINDPVISKCNMLAIETLEMFRHEFLNDMTPYDLPTVDVPRGR